ncbi:PPC domain-containing protein [Streptomyces sp. NPDC097619]|uniref:PPC domain-containing protein n=1 Tax=Streptomyces sp. NPDC097619 TaxID=3157228 RepID=UPI00331AB186
MAANCYRTGVKAAAGDYRYFWVDVPAGTTELKITVAGGTGNADLYYNPATWATTTAHTQSSVKTTNAETLTITNPEPGYRYFSLHAASAFDKVKVTTVF